MFATFVAISFIFATNAVAQVAELTENRTTTRQLHINDTVSSVTLPEATLLIMDSTYREMNAAADSMLMIKPESTTAQNKISRRTPDPSTATWLALAIPGGGQIYNRKFWKLPIVYGGFVGCLYAYNWNGQMYKDYRQAYLDIMDSDPNTDSFKDFFRPGYDYEANKEYLKDVFKKRKDRYRRWRDLSIFSFIGVYALSVIDAYVDAQLSNFDISEDINMSIEPQIIDSRQMFGKNYYGFNCNIRF